MIIEIVKVGPEYPEKNWQSFDLVYSKDGKIETKTMRSFGEKDVYSTLKSSNKGDVFDIETKKDGKYWNWVGITKSDSAAQAGPKSSSSNTGTRVTGSNYETPQEREWNRVKIGRQAVLNTAVNMLKTDKVQLEVEQVIAVAAQLETWVNRAKTPIQEIMDMEDDVPM